MQSINRVILTGNLTRDPETRTSGSLQICTLRIASNTRRKNSQTNEYEDKPNYFDVVVFGAQGENCHKFLAKGRGVAVDGRLDWREWESEGGKRQAVQIIADSVQFLDSGQRDESRTSAPPAAQPAAAGGFSGPDPDEDIPFAFPDFPLIPEIQPRGAVSKASGPPLQ